MSFLIFVEECNHSFLFYFGFRVMALSGNAISNFFSYSPIYSALIAKLFLVYMGINVLEDPESIHQRLITAPMGSLLEANRFLLDQLGLVTFTPVIETPAKNFTAILPRDAELLLDEGWGKENPILFGVCSNEAQTYKKRLAAVNLETKLRLLPQLTVPLNLLFTSNPLMVPALTFNVLDEYYNNSLITLDQFCNVITDSFYKYPVLRAIEKRVKTGSGPTFQYEFSYHGQKSIVKEVLKTEFPGAGHLEDITYFFRLNAVQGPLVANELTQNDPDSMMREWMTRLITNFIITG